jgi:hypothetical protein
MPWLKSMTGKGLKRTFTFLARWANLAKVKSSDNRETNKPHKRFSPAEALLGKERGIVTHIVNQPEMHRSIHSLQRTEREVVLHSSAAQLLSPRQQNLQECAVCVKLSGFSPEIQATRGTLVPVCRQANKEKPETSCFLIIFIPR